MRRTRAALPIPEVRRMSDRTLAVLRAALADRVTIYQLREDLDGPDPHRDAQCRSYAALLAMVDAERARRRIPRRRLFASGRLGLAADAQLPEHGLQDLGDVHHGGQGARVVAVSGVDVPHEVILCEEVAR